MVCHWCKKDQPETMGLCPHCSRFPNQNKLIGQVFRGDKPNKWTCKVNGCEYPVKDASKLLAGLHEYRFFLVNLVDDQVEIIGKQ